jgi:pyruvate dehydrogenase E1 component alpha subunit
MAKTMKNQATTSNKYSIPYIQVLDAEGNAEPMVVASLGLKSEDIRQMYRWMVTARIFDERALALQRQGRLGTYAPLSGQEACQIGSGYALKPEDWMFPSYREHAVQAIRGQRWLDVLTYWGGSEEGNRIPEQVNNFTISIPIATQICHATGAAWAMRLRDQKAAVIVYFGDGATSEGDFHEGLNFASVFKTGAVFFCQNNQYAISVPRSRQMNSETIAQKAIAYGMPGVQVDGNDVFAVYQAAREALERGRNGGGPTLIEAVTYRLSHHTTADDWTRYRPKEEVEEWKKKDPILRVRLYMQKQNIWNERDEQQLQEDARAEIAQVVQQYEALPRRDVTEIFRYVYAEMPWNLQEQLAELQEYLAEHGGDLPKE